MGLSDAMLAEALLEYLHQDFERLEKWILNRCELEKHSGVVVLKADEGNRRLVLTVKRLGQDASTVSERDYAIRIETINKPR